jgi:hypothetical protein
MSDSNKLSFPKSWLLEAVIAEDKAPHKRSNSQELTVSYLQNVLKLEDRILGKIVAKHSYILYLDVENNIKPTVKALQSLGFKMREISYIVGVIPSLLSMDQKWTIPEHFISIKQMYGLSKAQAIAAIIAQPHLLTCSVDRNLAIVNYLGDVMGFTATQIRRLIVIYPRVALLNYKVIASCWEILIQLYGLNESEARAMIMRSPRVLSSDTIDDLDNRLQLFTQELSLSPPFSELCNLLTRHPPLVYIDVEHFIRPNVRILRTWLKLGNEQLTKFAGQYPQLLTYNPKTLQTKCMQTLYMLTGMNVFDSSKIFGEISNSSVQVKKKRRGRPRALATASDAVLDNMRTRVLVDGDNALSLEQDSNAESGSELEQPVLTEPEPESEPEPEEIKEKDLLKPIVYMYHCDRMIQLQQQGILDSDYAVRIYDMYASTAMVQEILYAQRKGLLLSVERSLKVVFHLPWLLGYRLQRSEHLLGALSVTLGLTDVELQRVVTLYPRVFSLGVDAKMTSVLRVLAEVAIASLHQQDYIPAPNAGEFSHLPLHQRNAVLAWRGDLVRTMVRDVVVRFPAVLGMSMESIEARLVLLLQYSVPWSECLTLLRRSPRVLADWCARQEATPRHPPPPALAYPPQWCSHKVRLALPVVAGMEPTWDNPMMQIERLERLMAKASQQPTNTTSAPAGNTTAEVVSDATAQIEQLAAFALLAQAAASVRQLRYYAINANNSYGTVQSGHQEI